MPNRIKEIRNQRGLTQKQLADLIGVGWQQVNRVENGRSGLSDKRAVQYADALRVSVPEIYGHDTPSDSFGSNLRRVTVKGHVQAGYWFESHEWDTGDQYDIAIPDDAEFSRLTLHAAETRGPSMNRTYPEGTVLVFLDNMEAEESPQFGKRYIVERERADGLREATVKTLQRDADGKAWLLPDSDDPRHQAPIEINGAEGDTIRLVGRVVYSITRE